MQNGQTEPDESRGYPKLYVVQREAKFVHSFMTQNEEIRKMRISSFIKNYSSVAQNRRIFLS